MSDVVQIDYEALERISAVIGQQSERIAELQGNVRGAMDPLLKGGWLGRGRQAFEAEMQGEVMPAVGRLQEVLGEASVLLRDISLRYRQAEEEAAAPFRGSGDGRGASGGGGSAGGDGSGGLGISIGDVVGFAMDYASGVIDGVEKVVGKAFETADDFKIFRGAGKALAVVDAAMGLYDNWQHYEGQDFRVLRTINATVIDTAVSAAVGAGVAEIGAAVGTAIFPGVGTAIGGFAGAVIGGFAGSMATDSATYQAVRDVAVDVTVAGPELAGAIGSQVQEFLGMASGAASGTPVAPSI